MSRLADRMLAGCQPCRLSLMIRREEFEVFARSELQQEHASSLDEEHISAAVRQRWTAFKANDPVAKERFDFGKITNVPVITADDVAAYAASLPEGTRMEDVVSSMAPPFDNFFVEFQHVPNAEEFYAWGALVEARADQETIQQFEGDSGKPRWILELTSFFEREEGKPFGPVATHVVGLAEDGTWFRHSDGEVWWGGGPVKMNLEPPPEAVQNWGDSVAQSMFPVLLTISFMHCKNVQLRAVTPPEKLSRKHLKKHGHDLIRYHVLEIEPIRRILDKHRKGTREDLRRALHICRGHFKTFTPDAPLLGRGVGTYWWGPHVRGSKEIGIVLKDYRVGAARELGKAYREAEENPPDPQREAPPSKDPDSIGRGLAAHNRTQNLIAQVVRSLGTEPLSPGHDDPEFDIAWRQGDMFYVCEVKSITAANEERQLRMAIGQVIRYRQKLAAKGHEPIASVIATELQPSDFSWQELCEHEGILLLWPDVAEDRLKDVFAAQEDQGNPLPQSQGQTTKKRSNKQVEVPR
jgi:hypothetical protein